MSLFSGLCAVVATAVPLAVAAVAGQAAAAATAIYHSAAENVYGWCAGYPGPRARQCAEAQCAKHGGRACRLVVECSNGWGAVAFAEAPAKGFGASCLGHVGSARRAAITYCMAATNSLCWVEAAFAPDGKTFSEAGNRDADRVWFAQMLLQIRRLLKGDADGRMNPETRAAISTFQTRLGRPPTGDVDDELVRRLLDSIGGTGVFARMVKSDVMPPLEKLLGEAGRTNRVFSVGLSPMPQQSIAKELMARNPEQRLLALATYLAARNTKCTLPARSASLLSEHNDTSTWNITCSEGSYTLIQSPGSSTIIGQGGAKKSE